eukprot:CAMPEP_0183320196 /NCGR_PEP_ID=MMETSP0160_2-20130417/65652_1 /TAXON_ID=2839 ORGANISM="Odontella Sinensis, Strain Grunow 1884" /NCGR_SAMPLE_ID=MMETSP0160_2 /ASSEMBLY_ACC=CAM_ASM_000250 /LENGTH=94 /DNA_ID=CAMNT_0025486847 /DNA_START=95 /DNA_END=376 /DNA_ORIENTATION=+
MDSVEASKPAPPFLTLSSRLWCRSSARKNQLSTGLSINLTSVLSSFPSCSWQSSSADRAASAVPRSEANTQLRYCPVPPACFPCARTFVGSCSA